MIKQTDPAEQNPSQPNSADRPAELDELNFEDDEELSINSDEYQQVDPTTNEIGLTEASQPGQGPTDDDITPETLISEDGARSPREHETTGVTPKDKTLSIVGVDEIGAGYGLDEAELAEVDPLNKKNSSAKR